MDPPDEPEKRESRFGSKRTRTALTYRPGPAIKRIQHGPVAVSAASLARAPVLFTPGPNSRDPFALRERRFRKKTTPRVAQAEDDSDALEDLLFYGYDGDDDKPSLLTLRRAPQASQDQLWQQGRAALVESYYENASTLSRATVNKLVDRVQRWPTPVTCGLCSVGKQTVNYIGLSGSIDVDVQFSSCQRCSATPRTSL